MKHPLTLLFLIFIALSLPGGGQEARPTAPTNLTTSNCGVGGALYEGGGGFRCVLFNEDSSVGSPLFIWYGEGVRDGKPYRQVGAAFRGGGSGPFAVPSRLPMNQPSIFAEASEIRGDGAWLNADFPAGSLQIAFDLDQGDQSRSRIDVSGALNETWYRKSFVPFQPLPRPTTCGDYLEPWIAKVTQPVGENSGIRCALLLGRRRVAWFGSGQLGDRNYTYLGFLSPSAGTEDQLTSSNGLALCGQNFGNLCTRPRIQSMVPSYATLSDAQGLSSRIVTGFRVRLENSQEDWGNSR
jgi:hypothetical protein